MGGELLVIHNFLHMYGIMNHRQDISRDKDELRLQKDIKVEVVFGNPQNGCVGSGICRVSTAFSTETIKGALRSCRKAYGRLNWVSPALIKLDIYKCSLCSRLVRKHFASDTFQMPVTSSLIFGEKADKKLDLLSGNYDIEESQYFYTLYLKL
jgi:Fe-S-cluster-containing dehydrogenase component